MLISKQQLRHVSGAQCMMGRSEATNHSSLHTPLARTKTYQSNQSIGVPPSGNYIY